MVDATVILAGAIPAAVLALVADGVLLLIERALSARRRRRRTPIAVAAALALFSGCGVALLAIPRTDRIVVGSKNFTEQIILGELMAQAIERYTDLSVDRKLNLGGTFICDRALSAGDIDVYAEYSGTALTAVFKQPVGRDPQIVRDTVRRLYADTGRTLLEPFGFDNTFAILIRGDDARSRGIVRLSDLARHAPGWQAAFGYEFLERDDGYRGLAATYGLRFRDPPRVMDLTLIYRALADRRVDVIAGDATAGLIEALGLVALDDDRRYFPPYDAAPVMHTSTLLRHPQLRTALQHLSGRITASAMRRMNHAVDGQRRDPADVAREFLDSLKRGV